MKNVNLKKKLPLQITVKFRTMFLIKASSPKVDPSLMSYRCWMILESGTENGLIYLYIYNITTHPKNNAAFAYLHKAEPR